ncbi:MAG TPA: hypothetical protein PK413_20785 [Thermoanaerobaculia bacterium]|nr:hypothetical protein [Thermoanaerobaculia bacterium]
MAKMKRALPWVAFFGALAFAFVALLAASDASAFEPGSKTLHTYKSNVVAPPQTGSGKGFQIGSWDSAEGFCSGECSRGVFLCSCGCNGSESCCRAGCQACFDEIGCGPILN